MKTSSFPPTTNPLEAQLSEQQHERKKSALTSLVNCSENVVEYFEKRNIGPGKISRKGRDKLSGPEVTRTFEKRAHVLRHSFSLILIGGRK